MSGSPDDGDTSSDDRATCRAVATRFFEALAAGDTRAAFDNYDSDVVVSLAGHLEMCGSYRGTGKLAEWGREVFGRLEAGTLKFPTRYRIVAVDPPFVCAIMEAHAVAKDGLVYNPTYSLIFEIGGGKIVKEWEFADTALLEQLMGNRLSRPQSGAGAPFDF